MEISLTDKTQELLEELVEKYGYTEFEIPALFENLLMLHLMKLDLAINQERISEGSKHYDA